MKRPDRPMRFDVVDREMAAVLAEKSPAEKLAIAAGMYRSARRMIESHLRASNPSWDDARVERETLRRLSHGSG